MLNSCSFSLSLPTVSAAQYNDIPGKIEAEWFAEDGEDVGYFDTTPGNEGADVRVGILFIADHAAFHVTFENIVPRRKWKFFLFPRPLESRGH